MIRGRILGFIIMALLFIPAAYRMLRRWVAPQPKAETEEARAHELVGAPA